MGQLDEVVRRFRGHPGRLGKASIGLVTEVLGPTDWVSGPGDDTAVVPRGDGYLLVAGEAIWPPYIEADPHGAGVATVLANVNDVAAMGGRSLAIVDTIVGPEPIARGVLEGMRWASVRYGAPVAGGHLTIRDGAPAVSAFVLGEARALLSSSRAGPGQTLLVACALNGEMRKDFPFFSALADRERELRGDLEALPAVAEAGSCVAAKDVSMAGVLGSLAMLLEPSGSGVTVDLERLPRPPGVALAEWVVAFPSFGFLLCAPPDRAQECRGAFLERGLACDAVGVLDGSGELRARLGEETATLLDVRHEGVTRLQSAG